MTTFAGSLPIAISAAIEKLLGLGQGKDRKADHMGVVVTHSLLAAGVANFGIYSTTLHLPRGLLTDLVAQYTPVMRTDGNINTLVKTIRLCSLGTKTHLRPHKQRKLMLHMTTAIKK